MRSRSILIVEDDKDACNIMCNAVRRRFSTMTTYCAENGKAGLELFMEHVPDVVVTDINMPEMDGIAMASAIRSSHPDAKFIVVTAYNTKAYQEKLKKIGCSEYLCKPLDFKKFFAAIEACVGEA